MARADCPTLRGRPAARSRPVPNSESDQSMPVPVAYVPVAYACPQLLASPWATAGSLFNACPHTTVPTQRTCPHTTHVPTQRPVLGEVGPQSVQCLSPSSCAQAVAPMPVTKSTQLKFPNSMSVPKNHVPKNCPMTWIMPGSPHSLSRCHRRSPVPSVPFACYLSGSTEPELRE